MSYEAKRLPTPKNQRRDHLSGKLVVVSMIFLGLALGLVALPFRKLMPRPPATQPVTAPSSGPMSRPA